MRRSLVSRTFRWLIWIGFYPGVLWAFAHAQIGSTVENAEMPTLDGGKHSFLGDAAANVFVFVKPGQEHSDAVLHQLAALEKETEGKSVHWAVIVSDRIPRATVEATVKATGIKMPVLIDVGDALYGKIGVVLHPCIGITDKQHVLVNYQHFTKIDYAEVVRARIRYLLKEISAEEMEKSIKPPTATMPTNDLALRHMRLSQKLLDAKRYEQAEAQAQKVIEKDPNLAAAHTLLGEILYAQGKKAEALKAFARALELDPADQKASAGKKACAE